MFIFVVFFKFLKERMQDTRADGKSSSFVEGYEIFAVPCEILALVQNFRSTVRNFRTSAKFCTGANFLTGAKFSHSTAALFCFDHKFFIRTLIWVILVPLENLESVESKYIQKEHF